MTKTILRQRVMLFNDFLFVLHLPHAVEPFTSITTLINVPLAQTVGVLFIPNIILLHIIQLLKCFYLIILTKAIIQLLIVFLSLSGIHAILLQLFGYPSSLKHHLLYSAGIHICLKQLVRV